MRTKNEIVETMRNDLKEYGVVDSHGNELSDDQIFELADLFINGFTMLTNEIQQLNNGVSVAFSFNNSPLLLAREIQNFNERVGLIFAEIGTAFGDINIKVDEEIAKRNQN